ncbi:MAG TPA: hypothetical protein VMF29_08865, partial [Candidatus Edwardsbacteria bacterium]|nr:hypothetical protein [Candidatus Edwardsbacteria bacterium]
AVFKVAINNFMAGGGHGYEIFNEGQNRDDTYLTVRQALAGYVRRHSPLEARVEGRITGAASRRSD